jgi:hypothetical protein
MSSMTSTPQNIYSSVEATSPAICIPRVFANITERRIAAIFEKLDLGELVRIDMILRTNESGDEFYRVFVHLAWGESHNATATRAKLQQPNGEVKVVYDDPWFWKLRASNSKGRRVRVARPEPFIDFQAPTTSSGPSSDLAVEPTCLCGSVLARAISAGHSTSTGPVVGKAYEHNDQGAAIIENDCVFAD